MSISGLEGNPDDLLKAVKERCKSGPKQPDWRSFLNSHVKQADHLFLDKRNNILYCDVPKAGSSSWLRTLAVSASGGKKSCSSANKIINIHKGDFWARCNMTQLKRIYRKKVETDFSKYFKFMFVRNPYTRLISAYNNKVIKYNKNSPPDRRVVRYRILVRSRQYNDLRTPVTFVEFLRFAIFDNTRRFDRISPDLHWTPATTICIPCGIQYDFIGKLENAERDASFVLSKTNSNISLASLHLSPKRKSELTLLGEHYRNVDSKLLQKVNHLFTDDFRLFGYTKCTDFKCILATATGP